MTATDELCRMLDERGVPYVSAVTTAWKYQHTSWRDDDYREVYAIDFGERKLLFHGDLTPEQAIAATLGQGTCHNISKIVDKYGQARFACSECGAWIDSRMLWNPECSNGESPWVKDCSLNFCPNCGRRVVDE